MNLKLIVETLHTYKCWFYKIKKNFCNLSVSMKYSISCNIVTIYCTKKVNSCIIISPKYRIKFCCTTLSLQKNDFKN